MSPNSRTLDVLRLSDLAWEQIRTNVTLMELSVRNTGGHLCKEKQERQFR